MERSQLLKNQGFDINSQSKKKLFEITASFLLGCILSVPLIVLLYQAAQTETFEISAILNRYTQPFVITVLLASTVSILCCILAIVASFSLLKLKNSNRKIFAKILPLSLVFPPFVGAIAYIDIYKSQTVLGLFGNSRTVEFLQAACTLTLFLYPYVLLPLYTRIRMIEPAHAKILSLYELSFWQKLKLYYIPHLKQVMFNSMLLVFLYVSADFGAVSILRMRTITTAIYDEMILRSGKEEASIISLLLLFFVVSVTLFGYRLVGKNAVSSTLRKNHKAEISPKSQSVIAMIILILIISFSVVLPLFKILFWLFSYWSDTSAFKDIWVNAKYSLLSVSINTLWIAGTVTVLTVAICYTYCLIKMRNLLKRFSSISQFAAVMHALPGIVVAFSIVVFKQHLPTTASMYWILFLYGYFLRFSGIAFMNIEPAFRLLSHQTVKIGDAFIGNKVEYLKKIILPSTEHSVVYSANYIFFNSVRELNIPLLLLPLGFEVLALRIWQTASVGLYVYTAPAILALILISVPSILLYIKDQI